MLPDWVSNPEPLTYESGALPIALRGPAPLLEKQFHFLELVSIKIGSKFAIGRVSSPENMLFHLTACSI